MAKISVIGGGSWGTALAQLLLDNKHQVVMYTNEQDVADKINKDKTTKYFPNITLHPELHATTNLRSAVQASDYLLLVVPTKVIREVLSKMVPFLGPKGKVFINASKGIEPDTFLRMSEIVYEVIPAQYITNFAVLSGPSHAEEVIERMLTSVLIASESMDCAKSLQEIFNNNQYFRVYASDDVVGTELGGSLKNIIALTSGIIAGLGFGDNTRAALITRGLVEMTRLFEHMGGNPKTLYGLAGIGDLIVTATSKHSRNFQAGFKIGSGTNLKEALESMTMVVEGARTCKAAYDYAKKYQIDIPLIEATYDVIYNFVDPKVSLSQLMSRDTKVE